MSQNNKEFQFDKFVKDLEERENADNETKKALDRQEAVWQAREFQQKYREHPLHRVFRKTGDDTK
jgi:mRNA-degrading endonuclease YafQ of YafQ-DinJ toxin-antitoxin module